MLPGVFPGNIAKSEIQNGVHRFMLCDAKHKTFEDNIGRDEMNRFYLLSGKICAGMQKSEITKPLYRFVRSVGLFDLGHHLLSLLLRINPTEDMKREKAFCKEHIPELKAAYDCLEDERSKIVFENLLKSRATGGWTCYKKCVGQDSLETQYFVPELRFSDHEVIVDCGAFIGDTTKLFYEKIPGCRVIALEPEEENYKELQKLDLPGLKTIKAGAWSEDATLSFSDSGGGTMLGSISASGNKEIEVKALDHLPECQSATYIKMDIEGSELEALKGAQNIIKKNRPKLAICIYHKPQDCFEIPFYIKKLNPDYKLYIHHHNRYDPRYYLTETVLYAI